MMESKFYHSWSGIRAAGLCALLLGCQQQMGVQPSYRPLEPSSFFPDGRSARPLVRGTVARGQLQEDRLLFTGKSERAGDPRGVAALVGMANGGSLAALTVAVPLAGSLVLGDYSTEFPFPITAELLQRGQERYTIFCAVCHDPMGQGQGRIVQRGYTRPPSYSTDVSRGLARRGAPVLLRAAPVGYYFQVITTGYGAMASYALQVPPRDRWAIIAHIRALQLSQYASLESLPAEVQKQARQALEGQP